MSRYFVCELNKPALSYKCGESIRFEISAREKCINVDCKYVRWHLRTDDGKDIKGLGTCSVEKPLVIETTLERPGFARLVAWAVNDGDQPDTAYERLDAGVGADVDKIEYHDTLPNDFFDYWNAFEKLIENSEPELLYCQDIKNCKDGFKGFDMRVKTPEGRPASFVLTRPEAEGKYPIRAIFIGYGVHPAAPIYNEGLITVVFNAHGIENHLTSVELVEKYKGEIADGYGFSNEENASNKTTYWRGMIIRGLMGVKFLKTLKEWDGEHLVIAGGSQGAFQAATVAAHTKGVNHIEIDVPGFCDFGGKEKGYMRDWQPDFAEGLRYFDLVAQSEFIDFPVRITACLGDYICPPSGVMALYNSIKTLKSITYLQNATHGDRPNERVTYTLNYDPQNPTGEVKKGIYRHFKGNEYEVLGSVCDCETTEEMVIYKALYGEGKIWARRKADFYGLVCRDNKLFKRFEFIG